MWYWLFHCLSVGKRAGSWRERPVAHPESEDAARRPRDDPHLVGADETAENPWVEPTRGGRVPASLQHGGGHDDTDYEGELAARQNRLPAPAAPWTVPRPAPRPTRTSCAAAAALAAVTTSTPPGRIPATRPYRLTRFSALAATAAATALTAGRPGPHIAVLPSSLRARSRCISDGAGSYPAKGGFLPLNVSGGR